MCIFEPWHLDSLIDLKVIYPIGSIIFSAQPLGNKIEWELPERGPYELTVEWEGMTWELINDAPISFLSNPQSVGLRLTKVHSIRNVFVYYNRNTIGVPWTVKLFSDESTDPDDPLSNIRTFTGENEHKLTVDEMPKHAHKLTTWRQYGSSTFARLDNTLETNYSPYYGLSTQPTGGNQPHNNKEYAYNCFMYVRIQ